MKRWTYKILLVLFALITAGCGSNRSKTDGVHTYKVYYLNAAMTKLAPLDYETKTTDQDELVDELLEQFLTVPKNVDSQAALSEKVALTKYQKEDVVLYLYFDVGYNSRPDMNASREILCRAALAKTLTQIDGIDYINIYVGEQPLLDRKGNPIGMLAGSDFQESISDINTFERTELVLFFADETGEKLVPEKREVVHSVNTSLEKLIVEQLISGPERAGDYPTLSKETKLLNVSTNENICYINFDASFLNNTMEVKEYIPIYSIVNSLSELTSVNKVQITVDGSAEVMFRDTISLNTMFERNLDLGGEED